MEKFSYSKIDTFDTCPFKFKLKYRDFIKEPIEVGSALLSGSFAHLVLEKKFTRDIDLTNDSEINEYLMVMSKEDVMRMLKAIKKFTSTEFFGSLCTNDSVIEQTIYLDKHLRPCFAKQDAMVSGKVDYRENKEEYVLIIDWKTGKKTLKEINMYKRNNLQPEIYALWALQMFPDYHTIQTILYYIETNIKIEKLYSQEDVPKLKENIMSYINKIKNAKEFPRNYGSLCDYCGFYADHCLGEK